MTQNLKVSQAPLPGGENSSSSEMGPWTPVCKYFETRDTSPQMRQSLSLDINLNSLNRTAKGNFQVTRSAEAEERTVKKQFCVEGSAAKLTVLIATVPDPELTHLSMMFDRFIESMIWAATDGDLAKNRYSFNSYWFPWQPDEKQENESEKRKAAEKERDKRVSTPGLLLFRHSDDPERLFLIFLVGETPTSGVNRKAFIKAREYVRELGEKGVNLPICGGVDCEAILGPSFTGSLPSLKRLLNSDEDKRPRETQPPKIVISGSVSGATAETKGYLAPAHFCTTLAPEDERQYALSQYLPESILAGTPTGSPLFAYLREDETAYGQGAAIAEPDSLKRTGSLQPPPLILRFPRGIARMRNMSGELPSLNSLGPQNNRYPELPLDLRDTGQDTIPSFSRQTPVSQEAVLFELSATLKREHIRYAAVIATDPLDALFVSRGLRALSPNVRLVLFRADLLFARASAGWGLNGMLAVTTYPLVSRNQYYKGAIAPRRTQFADEGAEGEYNALRRMLLGSSGPLLLSFTDPDPACQSAPHQPPAKDDYLLDYTSPFASADDPKHSEHKPPVWISVLGHDAWWPVAAYPNSAKAYQERSNLTSPLLNGPNPGSHLKEEFTVEDSPHTWFAFFWLVFAGCFAHVLLVFALNIKFFRFFWTRASFRTFGWGCRPELMVVRRVCLCAASLAVAAVCLFLALATYASGLNSQGHFGFIASAILCFAAFAEALWAANWRPADWRDDKKWRDAVEWTSLSRKAMWVVFNPFTLAIAVAAGVLLIRLSPMVAGHRFEFAGYRAVHLESGTSPLPPLLLLLASLYCWLWFRLSQLRLEEDRKTTLKSCNELDLPFKPHFGIGVGSWAAAAAAVFCWCVFLNPFRTLATFDVDLFRDIIAILSALVVGLLALSVTHFLSLWRSLLELLKALERHPIRYSFTRFPKDFSWMTVWTGDPRPKLQLPMRSVEVLRMIPEGERRIDEVNKALSSLKDPKRVVSQFRFDPVRVGLFSVAYSGREQVSRPAPPRSKSAR